MTPTAHRAFAAARRDAADPDRRRFGRALAGVGLGLAVGAPVFARDAECRISTMASLGGSQGLEQQAAAQYRQMLQQAQQQQMLAPADHPQEQRLRYIARRLIPFATDCNRDASRWQWEVNLIGSKSINAFCMPGGKIAVFWGLLATLQLNDNEVAMVMGHEISHALLLHAQERQAKVTATRVGAGMLGAILGVGGLGQMVIEGGGQLLSLKFSRSDESEADALGQVIAARAGYDPRAAVTLWNKMLAANRGAPPQWMSTHPSGDTRIRELQQHMPRSVALYEAAEKPDRRFGPPTSLAPTSTR